MSRVRFLRLLAIILAGQALATMTAALVSLGRRGGLTVVVVFWILIFTAVTSVLEYLLYTRPLATALRLRRLLVVIASVAWPCLFYVLVVGLTGGYIANLNYPLLLIFIAGSLPSFVDTFWKAPGNTATRQMVLGWILVMAGGFVPFLMTVAEARDHQTRLVVVKNVPDPTFPFTLEAAHGTADLSPTEIQKLEQLGLNGKAVATVVLDLGPSTPPVSELIIVLRNPVKDTVRLREPTGEIVYLQEGSGWKKIPPDSSLDWREVELYSTGDATVISVWRSFGQRFSFQAVNWRN